MYNIHPVRSVPAHLIPACQAKLLMQIALPADTAVSVVKDPGKTQDTEWTLSSSSLSPHVSHLKLRCLVLAAHLGAFYRQKEAFLGSDYFTYL